MMLSRSGYTTVMDLAKLQKPAILIPTPGQPEQEYLAEYLMQKKMFYCVAQKNFSLEEALQSVENFSCKFPITDMQEYVEAINDLVKNMNKNIDH